MSWISQVVLIGLVGFESDVETHVVTGIHEFPAIIAVDTAEIRFHSGNRGQITVTIRDQLSPILGILQLEEHDVIDSGWPG